LSDISSFSEVSRCGLQSTPGSGIAEGATPQEVGGHPISVFIVVLIALIIGGLFYLYKRDKDYNKLPK